MITSVAKVSFMSADNFAYQERCDSEFVLTEFNPDSSFICAEVRFCNLQATVGQAVICSNHKIKN